MAGWWRPGLVSWVRGFLQAPSPMSFVTCLEPPHTLTPHDLLCIYCQLYPLPQPPPNPSPSTRHQPLLPACLRHLIQGQPGLPPSWLQAVTHSPCRLSPSMSSPRICDSMG